MTDRQLRWIPWALVSVGVLLRWPAMSGALWFDEIWLLSNVGHQTLAETLTTFKSDNNHPLYSILSWFGVHGFGGGAASLRLVALVFGVLSIAAAYRLASLLLPQRMAILLSVGLALSSHHIAFSTNARGYTALLFFSLNACFWFHHAVHGERRGAWWRCSLALALASFVHLTGVFLSLGLLSACLIDRRWSIIRIFLCAGMVSLTLHAPLLRQMSEFFGRPREPLVGDASWLDPLWALGEVFQGLGVGWIGGIAFLACGMAIFALGSRALWTEHRWFVVTAVVSPAALFSVLILLQRNIWPRLFFGFSILLLMIAIRGIGVVLSRTSVRLQGFVALVLIAAASMGTLRVWSVPAQDYPAAARTVLEMASAGERIVTVGLAGFPYDRVYPHPFVQVETAVELNQLRSESQALLVLYTFPLHLQSRHPAIWRLLQDEGIEVARTIGRVHGGDLVLLRL